MEDADYRLVFLNTGFKNTNIKMLYSCGLAVQSFCWSLLVMEHICRTSAVVMIYFLEKSGLFEQNGEPFVHF